MSGLATEATSPLSPALAPEPAAAGARAFSPPLARRLKPPTSMGHFSAAIGTDPKYLELL